MAEQPVSPSVVSFPGSPFRLHQPFPPAGDQPGAIAALTEGQPFARAEPDLAVTTGPLEEFALLTPRLHAAGLERIEKF